MLRCIVLFSVCSLLSLPIVAQSSDNKSAELALNHANQPNSPGARSAARPTESRISIRRLKVPRKARELYDKALAAWAKLAPSEAQRKVDQALKLDPGFPEALTLRGGLQASDQQWQSAEESLQAAIASDPSYSPPYVILAGVYNSEDRFDEAQQVTQRALSAGAQTWSVRYEIARSFLGKGQYQNALATAELSLRSDRPGCLMRLARAHALLGLRRYLEADTELRTFLQDQPSGDGSQDARDLLEQIRPVVHKGEPVPQLEPLGNSP